MDIWLFFCVSFLFGGVSNSKFLIDNPITSRPSGRRGWNSLIINEGVMPCGGKEAEEGVKISKFFEIFLNYSGTP